MGMVVQYRLCWQRHFVGPFRAAIARMGVTYDVLRAKMIHLLNHRERTAPLARHVFIAQIAKMLAQDRLPVAYQTKRIFHVCAQRQYRRTILKPIRQRHRIRHVAPRTT
ncbi:hypothetical protein D3C80_1617190 [compost metagenome]